MSAFLGRGSGLCQLSPLVAVSILSLVISVLKGLPSTPLSPHFQVVLATPLPNSTVLGFPLWLCGDSVWHSPSQISPVSPLPKTQLSQTPLCWRVQSSVPIRYSWVVSLTLKVGLSLGQQSISRTELPTPFPVTLPKETEALP